MSSKFDDLDLGKDDIIKLLEDNKKIITVKCLEFDKYGRALVELYNDEKETQSFNDILVEKNLAVRYYGGSKESPFVCIPKIALWMFLFLIIVALLGYHFNHRSIQK